MKTKLTSLVTALLTASALWFTTSPTLAQTSWGYALSFDGTNDYVDLPAGVYFEGDFTIEAWVYPRAYSAWARVVDFGKSGTNLSQSVLLTFCADSGLMKPHLRVGSGTFTAPGTLRPNEWVHLAATLSGTSCVIYTNGVVAGSGTVEVPTNVVRTSNKIAASNYPGEQNANVMLDEIRIWNVARTVAQIQANMMQPLTNTPSGLVAYWRFGEGAGDTAYDATTNHFNGTLVSDPSWVWLGPSSVPYTVTLPADGFMPTAATLNALVNPNGLATTAWFEWGTTTNYGNTTTMTDLGAGSNATPLNAVVSSLASNVTYHYRIAGSNSLGVAYGSDCSFAIVPVTSSADSGAGSLRQAISSAVTGATIVVTYRGTITLTSGELAINKDVSIVGPGADNLSISGNYNYRVFNIGTGYTVNISGLTIRDGKSADGANGSSGGVGSHGGGIFNAGMLTLSDCVVTNNFAGNGGNGSTGSSGDPGRNGGSGGSGGNGGGIYNHGTGVLTLNECAVTSNSSGLGGNGGNGGRGHDGGIEANGKQGGDGGTAGDGGRGGGIYSAGMAALYRCTVNGNTATAGGNGGNGGNGGDGGSGLWTDGGRGGDGKVGGTGGAGGGLYAAAGITLNDCTISGNRDGSGGNGGSGGAGGHWGTWGDPGPSGSQGNGGTGGSGGGIFNTSSLWLGSCTIASNSTASGGTGATAGLPGRGGGITNQPSASVQLVNTIVALNTVTNFSPDDVKGAFTSLGHNLIVNTNGSTGFVASDLRNVNPALGSLATNGGPTRTHALLPGSPAINAGTNTYASVTDQRGLPRIDGNYVDIGSFEFQAATTLPPTDITLNTAKLHGKANPNGMTTTARFEWGLTTAYGNTTTSTNLGSGTSDVPFNAVVTVPEAGTYHYRAVASNAHGLHYGLDREFGIQTEAPTVVTLPASNITNTAATLRGTVNPGRAVTYAWFEYGLSMRYGGTTPSANLGSGTQPVAFSNDVTGLLPWMTYHFRAVATNNVGRTDGPDVTFTLPGPSVEDPYVSPLPDVALAQGGSTYFEFLVSPKGLDIRVHCNNPVLLPDSGLLLSHYGDTDGLSITPATNHSGSAQVTVTASDGTHTATRTFTVTVTPDPARLLQLTEARRGSGEAWQFRFADFGSGSTNYTVQYRQDFSPSNTWTTATNVTMLADGWFEVNTAALQAKSGFWRVKGIRYLTAGIGSSEYTVAEGAVGGPVVVFNGVHTGALSYSWSDASGTLTSATVQVNGTTAVIPIPLPYATDNPDPGQQQYLTVRLGAGTEYALVGTTESSVTIEENDSVWVGQLQSTNGVLSFELTFQQSGGLLQGKIRSAGSGTSNALVQLTFTENSFTAVATNVPPPVLMSSPLFNTPHYIDLRFDAANSSTETNVTPTQIQGEASLVSKVPGRSYLDTAVSGTFLLLRVPTPPSTNEVVLTPVPAP